MKWNVLLSIKHYCCKGNWIANQQAKKKCKTFYYWYNFRHAHKVPFNSLSWGIKYNYIEQLCQGICCGYLCDLLPYPMKESIRVILDFLRLFRVVTFNLTHLPLQRLLISTSSFMLAEPKPLLLQTINRMSTDRTENSQRSRDRDAQLTKQPLASQQRPYMELLQPKCLAWMTRPV